MDGTRLARNHIYTKGVDWEYEKEWRNTTLAIGGHRL
jgi:hypothetical protein